MVKVRRGGGEEIPLVQSKEQPLCFAGAAVKIPYVQGKEEQLHFAGTAVKKYPTPKVRKSK